MLFFLVLVIGVLLFLVRIVGGVFLFGLFLYGFYVLIFESTIFGLAMIGGSVVGAFLLNLIFVLLSNLNSFVLYLAIPKDLKTQEATEL